MKDQIIKNIEQKTGIPGIANLLGDRLSGSELNSLLLEVFNNTLKNSSPALLLKQYQANRFVHPAETDMIGLLRMELKTLECLQGHHFQPIELSPAAQLGSCSVLATADQKKIVSATRNTEIVADATNSLALHIAGLKRSDRKSPTEGHLRFCTVHRHIRTQELKGKGFTAHFKIGCLLSSGKDTGSFQFESRALREQFLALTHLFSEIYGIKKIRFKLQKRQGYDNGDLLLERVAENLQTNLPGLDLSIEVPPDINNYYKGIQYKMIVELNDKVNAKVSDKVNAKVSDKVNDDGNDNEIEIADGGFVDWTQQLLGNRKERLLISGFGMELIYKRQNIWQKKTSKT